MSHTSRLSPRQSLFRLPHISLKIISKPRALRCVDVRLCRFFFFEKEFHRFVVFFLFIFNKKMLMIFYMCTICAEHYFIIFQTVSATAPLPRLSRRRAPRRRKDQTRTRSSVLIRCENEQGKKASPVQWVMKLTVHPFNARESARRGFFLPFCTSIPFRSYLRAHSSKYRACYGPILPHIFHISLANNVVSFPSFLFFCCWSK